MMNAIRQHESSFFDEIYDHLADPAAGGVRASSLLGFVTGLELANRSSVLQVLHSSAKDHDEALGGERVYPRNGLQ